MSYKLYKIIFLTFLIAIVLTETRIPLMFLEAKGSESSISPLEASEGEQRGGETEMDSLLQDNNISINLTPEIRFLSPKTKEKISQTIDIEVKVEDAIDVSFYVKKGESLMSIYLGRAINEEDKWKLIWDTKNIPNGSYSLFAEVANSYGSYQSEHLEIIVIHDSEEDEKTEEKKEELLQNKEQKEKLEKDIEKTIEEASNQSKEQAEETVEELRKKGIINSEEAQRQKDQVTEQIRQQTKEIMEATREEQKQTKDIEKDLEEKKMKEVELQEKQLELIKLEESNVPEIIKDTVGKIKQEKQGLIAEIQETINNLEKDINVKEDKKQVAQQFQQTKKENLDKTIESIIDKTTDPKYAKEDMQRLSQSIEENIKQAEKEIRSQESARIEIEKKLWQDSDGDGLADVVELEIGSDPFNPDTSGDGYLDGIIVVAGHDPLIPVATEKLIFQDPRKISPKRSSEFFVEKAEIVISSETQREVLRIEGKGLPNSFVNIYLYSLPVVITTRTDEYGRWVYELDKSLEGGKHEVYVVLNNSNGEIVARSETFAFIKTGANILRLVPEVWAQETGGGAEEIASPFERLKTSFFILTISIILLAVAVAIVLIGFYSKKRAKRDSSLKK